MIADDRPPSERAPERSQQRQRQEVQQPEHGERGASQHAEFPMMKDEG